MNKKRPPKAALTVRQLLALRECVVLGLGFLKGFLRHDDWDAEMLAGEKRKRLQTDKQFIRMIKLVELKIKEANATKTKPQKR